MTEGSISKKYYCLHCPCYSGSYFKVEGFAFLPIMSFSMALTTFTSQNMVARLYDRTKKGTRFGIFMGIGCAEIIGIFFTFAPFMIGLFTQDAEVIAIGVRLFPDIHTIYVAYLTWSLSSVLFTIYYFKADCLHSFQK